MIIGNQTAKGELMSPMFDLKVSKGAKIRNRYNQVPHLNQDTEKHDRTFIDGLIICVALILF